MARSVLDCGGKGSATPLSYARGFSDRIKPSSAPKLRRRFALPEQSKTWQRLVILVFVVLPSGGGAELLHLSTAPHTRHPLHP